MAKQPTTSQLDFLEKLTQQTGLHVNTPTTSAQARQQITNLLAIRDKATPGQHDFLEKLAASTGAQFTPPKTKSEARAEIDRLLEIQKTSDFDDIDGELGSADRRRHDRDCTSAVGNFAGIREDEVTGYGSSARWA